MSTLASIAFLIAFLDGCAAMQPQPGAATGPARVSRSDPPRYAAGCSLVPFSDMGSGDPIYQYEALSVTFGGHSFALSGADTERLSLLIKAWYLTTLRRYVQSRDINAKQAVDEIASTFNDWRVTITKSGWAVIYRDGFLAVSDGQDRPYAAHANRYFDDNEPILVDLETGRELVRVPFRYDGRLVRFTAVRGRCDARATGPVRPSPEPTSGRPEVRALLDALDQAFSDWATGSPP